VNAPSVETGGTAIHCDVRGCRKRATWAYIGESGDLYLCDDHHHDAPNWHRMTT
jgi:hypothetical protein